MSHKTASPGGDLNSGHQEAQEAVNRKDLQLHISQSCSCI